MTETIISDNQFSDNVSEPTTTNDVTIDIDDNKTSQVFDTLIKNIENSMKLIKGYVGEIRNLKKEVQFMEKTVKKLQTKKNRKKKLALDDDTVEKKKNGFARPTDITTQLADFLGIEHGVQIARTEVTKMINIYIKTHNLQDSENKKRILLTEPAGLKLKSILTDVVDKDGNPCDLNFINIQKYIKHHFPKKLVTTTTEVVVPTKEILEDIPTEGTTVKSSTDVKKKILKKAIKKTVLEEIV